MIRVLIAEDMHMIRGALVALLSLEDGHGGRRRAGARRRDRRHRAGGPGPTWRCSTSTCRAWTASPPPASSTQRLPECRTLVLTGLSQPGNLLRALKVHVRGFIVKDAPADRPWPTASAGSPAASG